MPQLSVIIPVYNAEKFINNCVDSILNQTFSDLEVVLVDDGSPDLSGAICDGYAETDKRVKVIHQKNAGVSAARNAGLDLAAGKYVTFVDSDDFVEPQMYEKMISVADKYDCDVVMCDCLKVFPDRNEVYTHDIRPGYYNKEQLENEYYPHLLIMENVEYPPTISNWLLLFKKHLNSGKSIPRYVQGVRFSEDLLFGAQLLYAADSFYYMKGECFYHYCMNPESATHSFKSDKWNDYKKLMQEIRKNFAACAEHDFEKQIDLVQLFFLYNAVGEIISSSELDRKEKVNMTGNILRSAEIREMFKNIRIMKLQIPFKLKIVTMIYKYGIGINLLIARESRK